MSNTHEPVNLSSREEPAHDGSGEAKKIWVTPSVRVYAERDVHGGTVTPYFEYTVFGS